MNKINIELQKYIPGGCHTYSKGVDQYLGHDVPTANTSKGVWVWDTENNRYLDWMMGNRVICLGHGNKYVNQRIIRELKAGSNHSFPSRLELEAAKYFVETLKLGEMVKFGKNGSDAVSAAVRLARAYTKKNKIIICSDQPFYAIHDWFIGSTASNAGVDPNTQANLLKFEWNSIASLSAIIKEHADDVACILLEVCKFEPPSNEFIDYLHYLQKNYGVIVISDENINCMKFGVKGAHDYFGLKADLICFGKAIANGSSFSMLAGPRKIMSYGGIQQDLPKVFLLSQTHSSESIGIAAAKATCEFYIKHNVDVHIERLGTMLKSRLNQVISASHLDQKLYLGGLDQNPTWITCLDDKTDSLRLRSWIVKQLMQKGILANWFTITYAHRYRHIDKTCKALEAILHNTCDRDYLELEHGDLPLPVFRPHQIIR